MAHIGFLMKMSDRVNALIIISLKENAQGRNMRYTAGPNAGIYSNASGSSPGRHTIPSVILLSERSNVKHNCANFAAGTGKVCATFQISRFGGAAFFDSLKPCRKTRQGLFYSSARASRALRSVKTTVPRVSLTLPSLWK